MRYIKQLVIILGISFMGEILKGIIPLTIPASIYGLILMLLFLRFKIICLEQVKEVGTFLIEIMPIMFIPTAVGLLNSWEALKASLLPIIIIVMCTTIIVMVVTGHVAQSIIRYRKRD